MIRFRGTRVWTRFGLLMRNSQYSPVLVSWLRRIGPTLACGALILGSAITIADQNQTTGGTAGTTGTTGSTATTGATATTASTATTGSVTTGGATGAPTGTTATTGTATTGATTGAPATTGAATTGSATAGSAQSAPPAQGAPPIVAPIAPGASPQLPVVKSLPVFGFEYFKEARLLIDQRRAGGAAGGGNSLQTAVGPDQMLKGGANLPVPERYQIGPGDLLSIRIASPVQAPTTQQVRVDATGGITVPGTGERVVVRGQTVGQANLTITRIANRYLRDAQVETQLAELRTISIRILGDAYAPGTYEVPSIITLFNALYAAGGPNDTGSFRNIELRRFNTPLKRIDLYRLLLQGDGSLDVPLQPGDTIFIPPADSRITVQGEVRRPAIYEIRSGEKLKDVLAYAGGAKPTGITQQVSVESVRPGVSRVLIDANLLGRSTSDNPVLYDGDSVDIFSIRPIVQNAVRIEGAVDQPRSFGYSKGMRVSDLLLLARGTIEDTYLDRADLYRQNPDGSTTLIPVRLRDAIAKIPAANIELQPSDRIRVYSIKETQFLSPRRVTISGAVQRPGLYVRSNGQTLRDLLIQAGGLLPTANDRVGLLQRALPDGRPGPLVRVNLAKAAVGDPAENIVLQDDDVLTVNTFATADFYPEQIVEISGAVQRPGTFTKSAGMRLKDLIEIAGGLLPTAEKSKAYLQRVNPNGTQGPLEIIDLNAVLKGDPSANVEINIKDRLSVFTEAEAKFTVTETVRISGAVQRPGNYPTSSNLKLADLVTLAGGVLPNASSVIELSRAWQPAGTPVERISVMDVINGAPAASMVIKPGDQVTLPARSDIQERARLVYINGKVRFPGPYMLTGTNDRLSNLIQRAGGLVSGAFPEGTEFNRDPAYLATPKQLALQPRIAGTLLLVADAEYRRATALADLDRLRIVFSQGATISSSASILPIQGGGVSDQGLQPGASLDQALAAALRSEAATNARKLGENELVPSGNLDIDLRGALRKPNSTLDPILKDGDVINVPETPTTVTVTGAVVLPSAILYKPGAGLDYYLPRAGGLTNDASIQEILVIRATGGIVRYQKGVRIELGDNILIPTKVQAVRLKDNVNALQTITQTITSAGISLALIRSLTR